MNHFGAEGAVNCQGEEETFEVELALSRINPS